MSLSCGNRHAICLPPGLSGELGWSGRALCWCDVAPTLTSILLVVHEHPTDYFSPDWLCCCRPGVPACMFVEGSFDAGSRADHSDPYSPHHRSKRQDLFLCQDTAF